MKLIRCSVRRFGRLKNQTFAFSDGLNAVCQDNGWGKSTLCAFIKAMFYGLPTAQKKSVAENDRLHYLPWGETAGGGSLTYEAGGKIYRVERTFGKKTADDRAALYLDETGEEISLPESLGEDLFAMDADGFERTVFLSEMPPAEKNDNTGIAAKLSDVSGVEYDLGNLDEALARLDEKRKVLKKRTGGEIAEVAEEISRLTLAVSEAQRAEEQLLLTETEIATAKERLRQKQVLLYAYKDKLRCAADTRVEQKLAEQIQEQQLLVQKAKTDYQTAKLDLGGAVPSLEEIDALQAEYQSLQEIHAPQATEEETALRAFFARPTTEEELSGMEKLLGQNVSVIYPLALGVCLAAVIGCLFLSSLTWIPFALGVLFSGGAAFLWGKKTKEVYGQKRRLDEFLRFYPTGESDSKTALSCIREKKEDLARLSHDREQALAEENKLRVKKETAWQEKMLQFPCTLGQGNPFFALRAAWQSATLSKQVLDVHEATLAGYLKEQQNLMHSQEKADLVALREQVETQQNDVNTAEEEVHALQLKRDGCVRTAMSLDGFERNLSEATERKAQLEKQLRTITRTMALLQRSADQMKAKYLGKMTDAFREYIALLDASDGEFRLDTSLTLTKEEDGSSHTTDAYSRGTKDLFRLATRLSLVDALYEKESPFLVLDDPFAHFDKSHIDRGLSLLQKLGNRRQILYFTCINERMPK